MGTNVYGELSQEKCITKDIKSTLKRTFAK